MSKTGKQTSLKEKSFNEICAVLSKTWKSYGAGNNFESFSKGESDITIYVFEEGKGVGPNTAHWVLVAPDESFIDGGFGTENLDKYL